MTDTPASGAIPTLVAPEKKLGRFTGDDDVGAAHQSEPAAAGRVPVDRGDYLSLERQQTLDTDLEP